MWGKLQHVVQCVFDLPWFKIVALATISGFVQLRNHSVVHMTGEQRAGGSSAPPLWYTKKRCEICDKFFSDSKCLKKHIQAVHSKLKPYICHVCNHQVWPETQFLFPTTLSKFFYWFTKYLYSISLPGSRCLSSTWDSTPERNPTAAIFATTTGQATTILCDVISWGCMQKLAIGPTRSGHYTPSPF